MSNKHTKNLSSIYNKRNLGVKIFSSANFFCCFFLHLWPLQGNTNVCGSGPVFPGSAWIFSQWSQKKHILDAYKVHLLRLNNLICWGPKAYSSYYLFTSCIPAQFPWQQESFCFLVTSTVENRFRCAHAPSIQAQKKKNFTQSWWNNHNFWVYLTPYFAALRFEPLADHPHCVFGCMRT